MILLSLQGIQKSFGTNEVLRDASLVLQDGQRMGLVGVNGCGKSTLFNLIAGLMQPDCGDIRLQGESMLLRPGLTGYMLQKDHLLEWRTIYKNVLLGLEIRRELTAEKLAYVNQLLSDYGLDKFRSAHPSELSGGMRQRAALIRTLALKPELLLLDEPAAGMNPNETQELMNTIHFVRDEFHMTILLIEHDMKLVSGICEELTVLNFGEVLAQGKTTDVLNDPQVIKAYLGE